MSFSLLVNKIYLSVLSLGHQLMNCSSKLVKLLYLWPYLWHEMCAHLMMMMSGSDLHTEYDT